MRRRTLLVVLAGLALVAATVILLWLPRDPITLKNFDRILKGMTRAEVKAIRGASWRAK